MKSDIEFEDFIFHVVHHGDDEPILMDETPIKGFENFFRERIVEVIDGNRFLFNDTSTVLSQIKEVEKDRKKFVEVSKELATVLHGHGDDRVKPGVMIFMVVKIKKHRKYIIIKYDHETVIAYSEVDGKSKRSKKAVLQEIKNTFSRNKESLQKSAIVDIQEKNPLAIVVDKSEMKNVTQFFKGFLGIKRFYNERDLTVKLEECFISTVKQFQSALPSEFTSQVHLIFYDTVQNNDKFQNSKEFLESAFGKHYNSDMDSFFHRQLKKKEIDGEIFSYDKTIPRPKQRKLRTKEGVRISYPDNASDTVNIAYTEQHSVITITTAKITEE